MHGSRNQQTIARAVSVEGVGYWSGQDIRVEFHPADPDMGIVSVRTDLEGNPRIEASVDNRTETPLRTTLRNGNAGVDMVEHIMATLSGLQVDNCEIRVNAQEMPGCDGSARPFVDALVSTGIVPQAVRRKCIFINQVIRRGDEHCWVEARPCCSGEMILQYELDYGPDNPIGRQQMEITLTPESFREELGASRTFLLEAEARALQEMGLGQRAKFSDLLVFGENGPLDNELRYDNECVRHKLLDMVGDLALAGCDLAGRFVAHRSGHRLNAELVRAIRSEAAGQECLKKCA